MHYLEIFFDKWKTRGTLAVGLNEEGTNGLGKYIWGGITGNGRYNLLKERKDIDGHIIYHKRSLVWKIHEGVQVKYGSDKKARIRNHL